MSRWFLGEQHAQLEAPREHGQRRAVEARGDAEALQDLARARLERVTVVSRDGVLERREAGRIGRRRALGDPPLLAERLPHHGVPAHRELEDERIVLEEAILPEHAEAGPLGDEDSPLGGLLVPGEDAQEGGLAGAVRADEAIARARVELERDALEERARPVGLGEVGRGDHARRGPPCCCGSSRALLVRRSSARRSCRRPRARRSSCCRLRCAPCPRAGPPGGPRPRSRP
jgi:hypothetical protein